MEIIQIPTGQLVPHQTNAHTELRDIDELATTIEYFGILQPLTVIPVAPKDGQDRYVINAGHRRHAAAVQLGLETVPCIVAADRDDAEQIAVMLVENLHRQGLTASEEAAAYEQLALLDWEPERIAKATGSALDRVQDSLALRRLPDAVQQAADAGQVDLAAAAALTEFTGDTATIERILKRADNSYWGLQHAIKDEQDKRKQKTAVDKLKAQLTLDGVTVTGKPKGFGYEGTAVRATDLVDTDGTVLEPEQVKTLPGFAAFVDTLMRPPAAVIYCTDPVAYGYAPRAGTSAHSQVEREKRIAAQAEREAAIEAATDVRQAFLTQRYGNAKKAKPLFRAALHSLVSSSMRLPNSRQASLAEAIAGTDIAAIPADAGMDRLSRAAVARWIADQEDNLHACAWGRTFTADFDQAKAYLDQLTTDGYTLSAFESGLYDDFVERIAAADHDAADDEEEEEDQADDDTAGEEDEAEADEDPDQSSDETAAPAADELITA